MPSDIAGRPAASIYQRQAIERCVAELPAGAPLAAVVASPDVQQALAKFEAADQEAMVSQARCRNWNWRGIAATTFGTLAGAFLLLPIDHQVEGLPRQAIGAAQTLALAVSSIATLIVAWLNPLDAWRADRGKAEQERAHIFAVIVDAPLPGGASAAAAAQQKLDVTVRAFIQDQLAYFEKRAAEHTRLASKSAPLHLMAYLLILIAFLLGTAAYLKGWGFALPPLLGHVVDLLAVPEASRWQLGITTMASGILAYATARALMDEDERKAKLYTVTAARLKALLKAPLTEARAAASLGNEGPLRDLFARTRTILEHEHAVWSFLRSTEGDAEPAAP